MGDAVAGAVLPLSATDFVVFVLAIATFVFASRSFIHILRGGGSHSPHKRPKHE